MKKLISLILAALMLCGALAAAAFADGSPFTDVKESRWSYKAIMHAYENGYMDGVGGGKFDPAGTMTRGMVVTVLWRASDKPDVTFENVFTDVKDGKYYSKAVIWAKNAGVVNGVTENTFEPNGDITREQLATIIYRAAEVSCIDVSGRADLSAFPDSDKVHSYAKDALSWAVSSGIISGVKSGDKTLLDPRGKATREQFATIMMRVDEMEFNYVTVYNEPQLISHYTEKEYPLVDNADIYVAVDGDDNAAGDFDHPYATFNRAAEKVREIKGTKEGDIVVAFKAGDYGPLSVNLTAEDSGTAEQRIIYCAYGDGDVVFNNGIDIPLDSLKDLTDEERTWFVDKNADKIKKADISDKLTNYDPRTTLVMSDDGDCTLARFPDKYSDGTDQLISGAHETLDGDHILVDHPLLLRRFANYHTMDGLLLYGYLTTGWYKDLLSTDQYNDETGVFHIPHPEQARMGYLRYLALDEFDSRHWSNIAVANISEELDAPGEYWIDGTTGVIYVYDPQSDYHITGGGNMINASGTEYLTFRGLDFRNSEGNMIRATEDPRGLTLEGCDFTGCAAEHMVYIRGNKQGVPLDVTVTDCSFSVSAATGLAITCYKGSDPSDLFGSFTGVLVENNYFTLTNLRIGNMGALKVETAGPVVRHNHFYKCFWEGVDFRGAVNMIAEYNVFDQVCYNGDDTGVLNNWNSVDRCGNVVRYNLFMNIRGGTNGRYCLYLDDTAGTQVYSNIFYNVDHTAMNNGISKYNTFCDNVIINPDSSTAIGCAYTIDDTKLTEEAMTSGDTAKLTSHDCYTRWVNAFAYFDRHPDVKAQAEEQWPGYFDITTDLERWQEDAFCTNSSLVITGNREINKTGAEHKYEEMIAKHSTIENNIHYSADENPLFVNPAIGDYRIRDDVTDFPDIHFEEIGRY